MKKLLLILLFLGSIQINSQNPNSCSNKKEGDSCKIEYSTESGEIDSFPGICRFFLGGLRCDFDYDRDPEENYY